jgi:DNA-binding PadR family transcriptional regulator
MTSYLILEALAAGHRYGFDIMDVTGLPSGTVYPALRRFENEKLVRAAWEAKRPAREEGRPARRYYELTARGAEALSQCRERYSAIEAFGRRARPRPLSLDLPA